VCSNSGTGDTIVAKSDWKEHAEGPIECSRLTLELEEHATIKKKLLEINDNCGKYGN
jgi:hypothetical protein